MFQQNVNTMNKSLYIDDNGNLYPFKIQEQIESKTLRSIFWDYSEKYVYVDGNTLEMYLHMTDNSEPIVWRYDIEVFTKSERCIGADMEEFDFNVFDYFTIDGHVFNSVSDLKKHFESEDDIEQINQIEHLIDEQVEIDNDDSYNEEF